MTDHSHDARTNMVLGQILPTLSASAELTKAMLSVPRHLFTPPPYQGIAYMDQHLMVKQGRYIMSPMLFAKLAHLANISSQDNILDVSSATGYSSAVFSKLGHRVIAIESDSDLASHANHTLHQLHIRNVITIGGTIKDGHTDAAPYNVIFIHGAVSEIPESLINQLAEGGRLIAVLSAHVLRMVSSPYVLGNAVLIEKHGDTLTKQVLFPVTVFPLLEEEE